MRRAVPCAGARSTERRAGADLPEQDGPTFEPRSWDDRPAVQAARADAERVAADHRRRRQRGDGGGAGRGVVLGVRAPRTPKPLGDG